MANYKPVNNFSNLYNKFYGMFNTYQPQSASTLKDAIARQIRPQTDQDIRTRQGELKAERAMIDTDAASRGLGPSSWVTDVKSRRSDAAARDIQNMEENYQANLYNGVLNRLNAQDEMALGASQSAQNAALNAANAYYNKVFNRTGSGGGGGWGGSHTPGNNGNGTYQNALAKLKQQGYTTKSAVDYLHKGTDLQKVQKTQPKKKVTNGGVGINYLAAR